MQDLDGTVLIVSVADVITGSSGVIFNFDLLNFSPIFFRS